jgi:hypothetical protein
MALSDQQTAALLQTMQQAVQILQAGAGAGDSAAPEADGMAADPSMMGGDADDLDPSMGDDAEMMDDPTMTGMDGGMDGGMPEPGLHDRVEQLETHTGLKKAATAGLSLEERLDQLESIHLGQEYEGEVADRIEQLEGTPRLSKALAKAAQASADAPEQIDLKELINAAVAQGRAAGLAEAQALQKQASPTEVPALGELRSVSNRKAQPALQKAADDDEDIVDLSTIGVTGSLLAMYEMGRNSLGDWSDDESA